MTTYTDFLKSKIQARRPMARSAVRPGVPYEPPGGPPGTTGFKRGLMTPDTPASSQQYVVGNGGIMGVNQTSAGPQPGPRGTSAPPQPGPGGGGALPQPGPRGTNPYSPGDRRHTAYNFWMNMPENRRAEFNGDFETFYAYQTRDTGQPPVAAYQKGGAPAGGEPPDDVVPPWQEQPPGEETPTQPTNPYPRSDPRYAAYNEWLSLAPNQRVRFSNFDVFWAYWQQQNQQPDTTGLPPKPPKEKPPGAKPGPGDTLPIKPPGTKPGPGDTLPVEPPPTGEPPPGGGGGPDFGPHPPGPPTGGGGPPTGPRPPIEDPELNDLWERDSRFREMLDKLIEDYENGIHPVTREVLPEELASEQLKRLLGRNSPLLNLAREQGINLAAGRGLMNSSLAGASAVNAMVEKMAPFAVADAATYAGAARENMAAMNEAEFRRYQTLGQLLAQGMDIEGAWERAVLGSQTAIKTTEMDNAARVQVAGIAAAASRYSSDRAYQAALERIQSAERMQLSQQEWASAENEAARNLQQQLFQEEWGFRISENETERAWRTGEAALDREFNAFLRDNQYAAQDRWNAAQLVGNMNLGRAQEIASINQNPNISNAQRENAIRQANERWDQNIQDSLAAMGISFDFGTGP